MVKIMRITLGVMNSIWFYSYFDTHSCLVISLGFKVISSIDAAKVQHTNTCRLVFNTFPRSGIIKNINYFTLSNVLKYVNRAKNVRSSHEGEKCPILFF